jgi:hypothetical protein
MILLAVVLAGCASNTGSDVLLAGRAAGHPITLAQYQSILRLNRANAGAQGNAPDWQSPSGRQRLSTMEQDSLNTLIDLDLARNYMAQHHLTVPTSTHKERSDYFNGQVAQLRASLKADPSNTQLRTLVDALTPDTVNTLIDSSAIQNTLTDMPLFPKAHFRGIVVKTEADARALQQQAEQGADFGQLAHDHSIDSSLAAQNGELGTLYVGQLVSSVDRAVFGPGTHPGKYVIAPISGEYVLFEITDRGMGRATDAGSTQTQSIYDGWLNDVVRPATTVDQYVTLQ